MTASLPKASDAASTSSARTEAIRQTAARLFEAAGYASTTMNDIADAVGVLPGSLYHHFRSKEDIAVDLLLALGRALDETGEAASQRMTTSGAGAEAAVRDLTADVITISFRHAAAVRLRGNEAPPTTSTERFREAMRLASPSLDRAWRGAVSGLAATSPGPSADLGLLRFALQRVALYAATYYPATLHSRTLAAHLCDLVFHGLVSDPLDDAQLDSSAAFKAASDAIARWRARERPVPRSDREEIVAAARAEFARRGYDATTIRDIANAAGVRMGTLYRRVESKEALLREIVDAYAARFDQAFRAVLSEGSSPPEALDALARVFVHISRHYHDENRIVQFGWSQREAAPGPLHDYFLATEQRFAELKKLMRRGFTTGSLRPIAGPAETALHFRMVLWQPFQEHARTSEARAHGFLRQILSRGALSAG